MKRLCAAVTVTVSLCLFVLFVTREPASTATRPQVPRDEQPGAMSPMLDSERHSNESTDPTSSSDWTTVSSTTEPTSTMPTETESSTSPTSTTTVTSSTSATTSSPETTTAGSTLATASASTTAVTTTTQPSSSAASTSSAAPPVVTKPPDQVLLLAPPTPPWLARQQQSSGSLVERGGTTYFTQQPIGTADTMAASATHVRHSAAPVRSTLATVSVRPTEPPTALVPDALAPTPTADARSMSIVVLAIIGGSLAAAGLAMALIRRRPGKHRG
jgi:hypothetical protein